MAVNALVKEGHDEHAHHLPGIFKQVESVMPESYYQELLEDDNCAIIIAKNEDVVLCFAIISMESAPPFDSMMPRQYGYIQDFGVKKETQKQGVGKLLFDACLDWAKVKGATTLELNVWAFNSNAINFYQHLGMESISRKMHVEI